MKLYELPQRQNIKIYVELSDGSTYATYHKMDGFYGVLTTEKGGQFNLSASTPLEPYKDGYCINTTTQTHLCTLSPQKAKQKNSVQHVHLVEK